MLQGKVIECLADQYTPKFLATVDAEGTPNVVPVTSIDYWDETTLVFAEIMLWKTRKNLEVNNKIFVAVITEQLDVWIFRCKFREWVTAGPMLDKLNEIDLVRYNAYMGIKRVGVMDVVEVVDTRKVGKLSVLGEYMPVWAAKPFAGNGGENKMPPQVSEKFARMQAVKLISYVDEQGYPAIIPVFSLIPTSPGNLIFARRLYGKDLAKIPAGAKVAACVITFEPISYQVKGTLSADRGGLLGKVGAVKIDQVYSSCPPLCGQRIDVGYEE